MNVDKSLRLIGFHKMYENLTGCRYERDDKKYNYTQVVDISQRAVWKEFKIQSYDKDLFDEKRIGNTCVALSLYELKLFYKKLKQMKRKHKFHNFGERLKFWEEC